MQIPYRQYGSRLFLYLVCLATTWNLRFCALAPVGALFILSKIADGLKRESEKNYEKAFGLTSLTSVVIGGSVTSIGIYAFSGCTSLTSIKYRGTEAQWNSISKGSYWNSGTGKYAITYNYTDE